MHVEDRRPEVHGCAHRAGHRVGDVVELQVEEQRCTAHGEANPVRPLGGKEFLADLHADDRAGQQLGESRSLVDLRGVEAAEDALVGQGGRGHGLYSLPVKTWWRPSATRRMSLTAADPVAVGASRSPHTTPTSNKYPAQPQ